MTKRIAGLSVLLLILSLFTRGQIDKFNTVDLHPVSPTAFQFLKYTEMPVSQYTGLPNINVPLYSIKVDGVAIPIGLNYHAQGIRVSQEASWVGLGWDLTMGSIVQQINDKDDYALYDQWFPSDPIVKRLPDFFPTAGDGAPYALPMRHLNASQYPQSGWQNPYPIFPYQDKQGYAVASDYYIPVNGQYDQQEWDLFNRPWYDSEPDIFTANFLGHSVKFARNFTDNNTLTVLNGNRYRVNKYDDYFRIIDPQGNQFFFELKSIIGNYTYSLNLEGASVSHEDKVSNIYLLTKIITTDGKTITIQYESSGTYDNYPNYSDKTHVIDNYTTNLEHGFGGSISSPGLYSYVDVTSSSYSGV